MNTKNIIALMFLIFFAAGASAQVYHYNGGNITDSAGIITIKKPVRLMNMTQDFGFGSTLWNFRLENDEGTITWRANNDRDLMVYDDDGHIWNLIGTLQVNGVPISAGGGDAYLTNRQTFTKRNIFSDTLKADALSLMEQVRIADWFQVNGDVISNFMFLKGSRTFTGTTDNYGFVIKTADTNRIEIDSLGYVTINKRLSVGEYVIATDSIVSAGFTAANMYFTDLGSSVYWRGYRSYIAEGTDELNYSSRLHNFLTKDGQNIMLELDSAAGMNLLYGSYTGSGTGLTNVDAITLKGQDTTHFARTDTLTTEDIKGAWNFWNIVRFIGIVTFDVSPVFNTVVNFANGITTTTITASSTATFNGDLVPTWIKNNSSVNRDQYEKVKVVRVPLIASPPYSATTFTAAHGITNWGTVTSWTCLVKEDSLNSNINASVYGNDASTANIIYNSSSLDSINVRIRIPAAAVNLFNDTAKFRITYSDYDR